MFRFLGTKIGVSVIVALVIVAVAGVVNYKKSREPASVSEKIGLLAQESVRKALESGQLDNPDWEDTLRSLKIGTTTDEIIKNLEERAATSTPDRPLTATDRFARELLGRYVELKESGAVLDENTGVRLANELLSRDYGRPPGEKIYTEKDIRVSNSSSLTEIKKYGNTLGGILDEPMPKGYENELVIVNKITDADGLADLEKLALNIARYTKIRDNTASVIVPSTLKTLHLSLINSLSKMIEGVKGMKLISTDPIGATNMILGYEDGLKSLELVTSAYISYFKKQNVVFSSTEPGYIFVE